MAGKWLVSVTHGLMTATYSKSGSVNHNSVLENNPTGYTNVLSVQVAFGDRFNFTEL